MSSILDGITGPFGPFTFSIAGFAGVILNVALGISLSLSVIATIAAGVKYIISGGDSKAIGQAKQYLTAGIIAMVIAISALTIRRIVEGTIGISGTL